MQDEMNQLTESLFEVSDDVWGLQKEKIHALEAKEKIEVVLQKRIYN